MEEDPNLKRFNELLAIREKLKWWQFGARFRNWIELKVEVSDLHDKGY